jgi:Fe2+ transport system protein FeoA
MKTSSDNSDGCCARSTGEDVASIASLKRGQTGVVLEAQLGESDSALLRAMGLHPAARVRLCREGEPCIVAVTAGSGPNCGCGSECRIGLARSLAQRIFVKTR